MWDYCLCCCPFADTISLAEQKDLFVRARYDALANEGGKRAVKKAIDKKQKKVSQKEKKARPFAKAPRKRPSEGTDGPYAKRQKT